MFQDCGILLGVYKWLSVDAASSSQGLPMSAVASMCLPHTYIVLSSHLPRGHARKCDGFACKRHDIGASRHSNDARHCDPTASLEPPSRLSHCAYVGPFPTPRPHRSPRGVDPGLLRWPASKSGQSLTSLRKHNYKYRHGRPREPLPGSSSHQHHQPRRARHARRLVPLPSRHFCLPGRPRSPGPHARHAGARHLEEISRLLHCHRKPRCTAEPPLQHWRRRLFCFRGIPGRSHCQSVQGKSGLLAPPVPPPPPSLYTAGC